MSTTEQPTQEAWTMNLFTVWQEDDIDSSFYEDTDDPQPLYVCLLCVDCEPAEADIIRGYDPRDGMFERPGRVVESLGGIDVLPPEPYALQVEAELREEFETRRESMIRRGES